MMLIPLPMRQAIAWQHRHASFARHHFALRAGSRLLQRHMAPIALMRVMHSEESF
jgi:hypothetical protein